MEDWLESINNSKEFKKRGKNWNAPLIIKFEPVPNLLRENNTTGIFLDLKYGECKDLRYSKENDEDICDVILSADEATWIQLMEKGGDPTSMILKNRLSLKKGSLILLSTQSKAAKALLKMAPTSTIGEKRREEVIKPKSRTHFTTITDGLGLNSLPMQLFQKMKNNQVSGPPTIDYSKERESLKGLGKNEVKVVTHLLSLVLACKEASATHQLPLVQVISDERSIEEQMYMTSVLWEESNHLEFLTVYIKEVIKAKQLDQFHGPHFKSLIYDKLPQSTNLLKRDHSPFLQIKAWSILHIIVKRMIAKTCYLTLYKTLSENNILPGLQMGIINLKKDEARHETFASFSIKRTLDENTNLRESFEKEMEELFYDGTNIIQEIFTFYDDDSSLWIKKESLLDKSISEYQTAFKNV
ncbi:MAG: hypothetical protein WEA58_09215 [Balneolaceae bacterium]